jgi:hypothetical protein
MVPQQEQHTQGGAVEVSGVGEIDHITVDAGITVLISVTEGLMSAEIKTALYPDCQSLTVVTPASFYWHSVTPRPLCSTIMAVLPVQHVPYLGKHSQVSEKCI